MNVATQFREDFAHIFNRAKLFLVNYSSLANSFFRVCHVHNNETCVGFRRRRSELYADLLNRMSILFWILFMLCGLHPSLVINGTVSGSGICNIVVGYLLSCEHAMDVKPMLMMVHAPKNGR